MEPKQDFHHQSTLPNLTALDDPLLSEEIPKKIGPYRIEAQLRKGGMSFLYLGLKPENNTPIAIKVLSPRFVTNPQMVSQFLKEAEIISITKHPNIVKLYSSGEWENGFYIGMEFIQGISLKQFIMYQHLSMKSALELILQVSYALLHLHTHGVIHRDLKPENILITDAGGVKVIDFGIAQLGSEKGVLSPFQNEKFLGTPTYMSPEQKKNPLNVTFSTDIFSLGVILFELIVGKLSFGNIQISLLPKELQKIVKKTLESDLKKRYEDIVDFITDVSNFLKNETMNKKPGSQEEIKEVWNHLETGHKKLLPQLTPKWPSFDIGISKPDLETDLGSYYDFLKFADQSYIILMAEYMQSDIEGLVYAGIIKGMIQTLTRKYLTDDSLNFKPISFITNLNEMLATEQKKNCFLFQLLHLIPLKNQFSFISCGCGSLLHYSFSNKKPRFLSNQNPPLGEKLYHGFYETTDNWQEKDVLIAHSFDNQLFNSSHEKNFDSALEAIVKNNINLAAQPQANTILNQLAQTFPNVVRSSPKTLLSVQRIT